jgi:hypothetical protein
MQELEKTLITRLDWGRMEVTLGGQVEQFRDCKVWPGGAAGWNWKDTGTDHQPGIQPADLAELFDQGVEVLVLGCGVYSRLGVCPETEELLRQRTIEYHLLDTKQAVSLYNELAREGRRVGGIFHSTC